MRQKNIFFWLLFGIAIGALILIVFPFLALFETNTPKLNSIEAAFSHKQEKERNELNKLNSHLVDPEQAPDAIREVVMLGYNLMLNTPKYAASFVGDRLSCTHCHFAGGDTLGGENGGISLVGSAALYPKLDPRSGTVQDLAGRINACFERSMNGKPLPLDSKEMIALETYLHWISKGTPIYKPVPWLGLPKLKSKHVANGENGSKVYATYCAMCHGENGEGELQHQIPPVWGATSFNDAAGMNEQVTLASFIFYNMPYGEPFLTEEQALDVAEFIRNQSRPHFEGK